MSQVKLNRHKRQSYVWVHACCWNDLRLSLLLLDGPLLLVLLGLRRQWLDKFREAEAEHLSELVVVWVVGFIAPQEHIVDVMAQRHANLVGGRQLWGQNRERKQLPHRLVLPQRWDNFELLALWLGQQPANIYDTPCILYNHMPNTHSEIIINRSHVMHRNIQKRMMSQSAGQDMQQQCSIMQAEPIATHRCVSSKGKC